MLTQLTAAVSRLLFAHQPLAVLTRLLAAYVLQLLEGSAEIFGAELQLGSKASLKGNALAVFTWHGCRLSIEGDPDFV